LKRKCAKSWPNTTARFTAKARAITKSGSAQSPNAISQSTRRLTGAESVANNFKRRLDRLAAKRGAAEHPSAQDRETVMNTQAGLRQAALELQNGTFIKP
jgi:hypothetical protein